MSISTGKPTLCIISAVTVPTVSKFFHWDMSSICNRVNHHRSTLKFEWPKFYSYKVCKVTLDVKQ